MKTTARRLIRSLVLRLICANLPDRPFLPSHVCGRCLDRPSCKPSDSSVHRAEDSSARSRSQTFNGQLLQITRSIKVRSHSRLQQVPLS